MSGRILVVCAVAVYRVPLVSLCANLLTCAFPILGHDRTLRMAADNLSAGVHTKVACPECAASASASSTPDLSELAHSELAHPQPKKLREKGRSRTFDLGRCTASVEPEICASCKTEIHRHSHVCYAHDLKFCSEGCRCVMLHSGMMADGAEHLGLEGKYDGLENPCMHHDLICPHFASKSAGLVKHKFTEKSPRPSPVMHGASTPLESNICSISLPPAEQEQPDCFHHTLTKSGSCEISRSGSGDSYQVCVSRTGSGNQASASIGM